MAVKKAAAVRPARGQAAKAVEARPVAQERSAGGNFNSYAAGGGVEPDVRTGRVEEPVHPLG